MVFSSLMFMCIFLPIVLIAYNLSKNLTYKNTVLIIASLFFYAWGEPIWVVLLIFSAFVDYINGRIIDKYYARAGATIALVSSLVINLGLLAMFKYSGFFIENINTFLHTSIPNPNFKLPIGISFYTFQTLSYTIDMYRGKTRVAKIVFRIFGIRFNVSAACRRTYCAVQYGCERTEQQTFYG